MPQREGVDFGVIDRKLAVGGQLLRLNGAEGPIDDIFLPLYGAHQAANAAQALAAVGGLSRTEGACILTWSAKDSPRCTSRVGWNSSAARPR